MKRLHLSILTGALLGVLCILGVGSRLGVSGNEVFLISVWYNRVLMGTVIGLLPGRGNIILRGMAIGLLVSLASFLSTEFRDLPGFLAGIVYGAIIDYVATKHSS